MDNLCECGCGQETLPYTRTDNSRGAIKGQFARFVRGHGNRKHRGPIRFGDYEGCDVVFLPLGNDRETIVDVTDLNLVLNVLWCYDGGGYAVTNKTDRSGQIKLHRLIMNCSADKDVDHRNGNGLDNRRSNLRIVETIQNIQNQRPQVGRSSQYKGVSFVKRIGRWEAYIGFQGKKIHIGYFPLEENAARAYDVKAKELFGEFAFPNFLRG